ncbi:MAG: DUF192 domain-containing protein [Hyphomonadaceae bacterium]
MKKLLSIAVLAAAFASPAFAQTETLSIVSGDKTHVFQVEVAATPEARAKGLTGRDTLAKDHGLLVDYRTVKQAEAITMKGVKVELDMLFIGADGTVNAITAGARPGSQRQIAPVSSAAAVLEIAGGQAAALGLKPGDKVKNKIFGNGG